MDDKQEQRKLLKRSERMRGKKCENRKPTIGGNVPVASRSSVEASAVLLHDDASDWAREQESNRGPV